MSRRRPGPASSAGARGPQGSAGAGEPWPGWARAGATTTGFVAVLWLVQAVNGLDHQRLDAHGIEPRSGEGLLGIVFAPLLHAGWTHLEGNSAAALVLMFLVLVSGLGRGLVVTALVWVTSGLGVWLVSPAGTITVGASGLIFGWLVYLLVRGLVTRRPREILLGVLVLIGYGSVLLGALPGTRACRGRPTCSARWAACSQPWLLLDRHREDHPLPG